MSTTDYAITKAELEAVADLHATLDRRTAVLRELWEAVGQMWPIEKDKLRDLQVAWDRAKEELER